MRCGFKLSLSNQVRRKKAWLMGTMFAIIIVDDRKFSSILIIVENVHVRMDVGEVKNRICRWKKELLKTRFQISQMFCALNLALTQFCWEFCFVDKPCAMLTFLNVLSHT